jgi:outer membrane receptor for ferrienterochelin and colicins
LGDWGWAQFRAAGQNQQHRHLYGDLIEKDLHRTLFAEASLAANV